MCLWVGFETRTVKLARGKNHLDGLKRICEFWSYKKSNSQTRESKSQCHLFGFCRHLRGHVFFLFFIFFIFFTRKSESSHLPHLRLIFIYIQSDAKHLSPYIFAHNVIFFLTQTENCKEVLDLISNFQILIVRFGTSSIEVGSIMTSLEPK